MMVPGDSSIYTDNNNHKFVAIVVAAYPDGTYDLGIVRPALFRVKSATDPNAADTVYDPNAVDLPTPSEIAAAVKTVNEQMDAPAPAPDAPVVIPAPLSSVPPDSTLPSKDE